MSYTPNIPSIIAMALGTLGLLAGNMLPSQPISNRDRRSETVATTSAGFSFEVLSIKPHKAGFQFLNREYMLDGYRASEKLDFFIKLAYVPKAYVSSASNILQAPDWIFHDWFDIDARVAPSDMTAWQTSREGMDGTTSDLLRQALRSALTKRFNLTLHTSPVDVPCLNLVSGKGGARLTATTAGNIKPVAGKSFAVGHGFYIQNGDKREFVGVSLEELAGALMRRDRDTLIVDKTGLDGRYDFVLPWYESEEIPLAKVGLSLKRGRCQSLNLVIDHIERPDAN
jgi:uncharacterized protein (TIGR03435 family)